MIRLALMSDPAGIIGARDAAANAARFPLLPPALLGVMDALYQTKDAVVAGAGSLFGLGSPGFQGKRRYCLTRDTGFATPPDMADLIVVDDVNTLAARYAVGEDELLVIGGLALFRLFLPYASRIDIAMTDALIPGDLAFADWRDAGLEATAEDRWQGGRTLHLVRPAFATGPWMDGRTIRYTYSGGMAFEVAFRDGTASYKSLVNPGQANADIPYLARVLRPGLIHTIWHEEVIGDLVSLVIDLAAGQVFSAALLGYGAADRLLHFEDAVLANNSN